MIIRRWLLSLAAISPWLAPDHSTSEQEAMKNPGPAGVNNQKKIKQRRMGTPISLFVFVSGTCGNQADLLAAKLYLKLIAGPKIKQSCVGLADQQVAVALHSSDVAEFASTLTNFASAAKLNALGFQQSLIKGGEVKALAAILLIGDIAAGPDDLRFTHIAKLFDFGKQFRSSEHRFRGLRGEMAGHKRFAPGNYIQNLHN